MLRNAVDIGYDSTDRARCDVGSNKDKNSLGPGQTITSGDALADFQLCRHYAVQMAYKLKDVFPALWQYVLGGRANPDYYVSYLFIHA